MTADLSPNLLTDHHILITGGGSGLGAAMAQHFAAHGAQVTICGRTKEKLDTVVGTITDNGQQANGIPADIRDIEAVEALFSQAEELFGPITALVNNAAGNFLCPTESITPRGFDAIVGTNLYGTFNCTQTAGKRWISNNIPGRVVSIVTTYASIGSAFVVPSAVSKAGIVALTRSLAVEWGRNQIRLNAIAPGPVPTEGAFSRLVPTPEIEANLKSRVPLGRFGEPTEVADLAAFLLSDLSSYLTGEVIALDGGEHLAVGGQFNDLLRMPPEALKALLSSMRK